MVDPKDEMPSGEDDPRLGLVRDLFQGRYEIGDKLPWGGLAIVYGAREPGREVAVSVLPLDCGGAPEIEDAFEIWAGGLEAFQHPGHVPVTDSGVQHGVPYLELERAPGETLWQRGRAPSALEALRVGIRIAEVVEAAHELDLVHWDLTPANVLLEGEGEGARVRVLGFGVAPLLFSTKDDKSTGPTGKGSGPKARRFMAPERLANAEGGLRADQYSLATLVYFLLRGEPPPKDGRRPALSEIDGLEAVVARAMEVDPLERFSDVRTLRQALHAVLTKAQRKSREPSGLVENLADALEPGAMHGAAPAEAPPAPPAEVSKGSGRWWLAAVLLLAVAGGGYVLSQRPVATPDAVPEPDHATPEAANDPPASPGALDHARNAAAAPQAVVDAGVAQPSRDADAAAAPEAELAPPSTIASGAPFAPPLPDLLSAALARVESGPRYTEPELAPLYGYATAHPNEARAHAVMGHVFVAMHWNGAAADAFARAARVDTGAWSDSRVLRDLLLLAASRDEVFAKVWPPLRNRFGRAALPAARAALEQARAATRARLRRLIARLERLPTS